MSGEIIILLVLCAIAIIAFIIAIIAEVGNTNNASNFNKTITNVQTKNGFAGTISNQNLEISNTVTGILKGVPPDIITATNQDITSTLLTDFNNNIAGPISATDSILTALGKLSPAVFNGSSAGPIAYTLGTIVSGSMGSQVTLSLPPSFWTYDDAKLTYNGPSNSVFKYGIGCGFATDTIGTYNISIFINGVVFLGNLNASYAGATSPSLISIFIEGSMIFNTGDYFQFAFDKGADIVGSPIVTIYGLGFNANKLG